MNQENQTPNVIGNEVVVNFTTFNKSVEGKVDTGATICSLHATDLQPNQSNNSISFRCPAISDGVITTELDGSTTIVSADAGGNTRPMIKLDIEINGQPMEAVSFNLNDRSKMDSQVLIGQNALKVGNFVIDVNKDADESEHTEQPSQEPIVDRSAVVQEAVKILVRHNITLQELLTHFDKISITE
jgi:hypothetical protein